MDLLIDNRCRYRVMKIQEGMHIRTFAVTVHVWITGTTIGSIASQCPCMFPQHLLPTEPLEFVGQDYFCDTRVACRLWLAVMTENFGH